MTQVQFLVLRAEDLVVLGVGWSDMRVVGAAGSGPTVLEATSDQSVIVLGFPPQHIGEQALATGSGPALVDGLRVFQSRLAGASRVAFHPLPGQRVTLTPGRATGGRRPRDQRRPGRPRTGVVAAAASGLPFRANSFDVVIHTDVLC